jgi:hypothetical protein
VGWMTRCRGSCQHGCLLGAAQALARTDPPTSSSLAEEKRLCSLLLSTAGARLPTLAADIWVRSGSAGLAQIIGLCAPGR